MTCCFFGGQRYDTNELIRRYGITSDFLQVNTWQFWDRTNISIEWIIFKKRLRQLLSFQTVVSDSFVCCFVDLNWFNMEPFQVYNPIEKDIYPPNLVLLNAIRLWRFGSTATGDIDWFTWRGLWRELQWSFRGLNTQGSWGSQGPVVWSCFLHP